MIACCANFIAKSSSLVLAVLLYYEIEHRANRPREE